VSDADMNRLYAVEQRRWEHQLDWDLGSAWTELERGRQLGTVSGLVAIDRDGRIGGWTYYLVHEGALQIGGLVAESEAVTSALLADVLADPDTHIAERVTVFAFTDAPGLVGELRARGLAVDRYWYLRRNGLDVEPMGTGIRIWSPDDMNPAAALLEHRPAADRVLPGGTRYRDAADPRAREPRGVAPGGRGDPLLVRHHVAPHPARAEAVSDVSAR